MFFFRESLLSAEVVVAQSYKQGSYWMVNTGSIGIWEKKEKKAQNLRLYVAIPVTWNGTL